MVSGWISFVIQHVRLFSTTLSRLRRCSLSSADAPGRLNQNTGKMGHSSKREVVFNTKKSFEDVNETASCLSSR